MSCGGCHGGIGRRFMQVNWRRDGTSAGVSICSAAAVPKNRMEIEQPDSDARLRVKTDHSGSASRGIEIIAMAGSPEFA